MSSSPTARILVVEDEFATALDIASALRDAGHEVVGIADTVQRALEVAEETRPEMALVDVRLAGDGSGLDVSKVLQERFHAPSILITAHLPYSAAVRANAMGYIAKPFSAEEIVRTVAAALDWLRTGRHSTIPPAGLIPAYPIARDQGAETQGPGTVPSVLVVDDDRLLLKVLKECLSQAGYHVATAENGSDALRKYQQARADVVVLDVFMPEQDGIETIRSLKAIDPDVRAIMISGNIQGSTYLRMARNFGAQETLSKPFTCEAMTTVVQRLMDAGRPASNAGPLRS